MKKKEILELIKMINDNEEGHKYSEEDWLVKTVESIMDDFVIDTINIYSKRETESLEEDISSLGTEIIIDVDNKFTSARTSKIEMYAKTDNQFLDFEVTNLVSFNYKDNNIDIIKDEKETDDVDFNKDEELIILRTDFIYTSDRGLDTKKILDIYIPYSMSEILDEEVDY